MHSENITKLKNDFPNLFGMSGYTCHDGWFNLIYKMGKDITEYCNSHNNIEISSIYLKEKYGCLDVTLHYNGSGNEILKITDEAEYASEKICDICGKAGTLNEDSEWVKTRCKEHWSK